MAEREREREITALFTFNTSDIDVRGHGGQICVEEGRGEERMKTEGTESERTRRREKPKGAARQPPKAFEGKRRNRRVIMMIDSVLGIV